MHSLINIFTILVLTSIVNVQGEDFSNFLEDEILQGNELQTYSNQTHIRNKRSVVNLCRMMECTTGRNCRDFLGYGCWCGIQSSGRIMDSIDRCCYFHDQCAERSQRGRCRYFTARYSFSCNRGNPSCNARTGCQRMNCECDAKFARCIARQRYRGKMSCSSRG